MGYKSKLMMLAAISVAAGACGGTSSSTTTTSAKSKFVGCLVTDTGGINDRSFNASAWAGMQQAAAQGHFAIRYLQSPSSSDYASNIADFVAQKCGIIVTVGFDMGPATQAAAIAHPKQKFAIVDFGFSKQYPNVDTLQYQTNQDGFLGGYLAAAMSKSGVVGTFGGLDIPTVTIYMDGFVAGVRYYDLKNHAHVKALGWVPAAHRAAGSFAGTGLFTGSFTNENDGKLAANSLMQQGADVIFPVAGPVGLGAAAAVQQANNGTVMEWVDTDGCVSAPQYCPIFLTSVTKGITVSVKGAALAAANGTFRGGSYTGTLANGGVALAPFHDFSSKVPAGLKATLAQLKAGIIAGKISVDPNSYPAS